MPSSIVTPGCMAGVPVWREVAEDIEEPPAVAEPLPRTSSRKALEMLVNMDETKAWMLRRWALTPSTASLRHRRFVAAVISG